VPSSPKYATGVRQQRRLHRVCDTGAVRVFVSSVIAGFEPFRDAAIGAARLLRHDVIRAEDFPARAASPQQACLEGVRDADVVVLLLGERYGQRQASGKSATEEEFEEAVRSKPILVFDQTGAERDPDMIEFVRRVRDWAGGSLTASFTTPAELRDCVVAALAEHAVREQAGRIDDDELIDRVRALLPRDQSQFDAVLAVSVSSGPRQQVLRPAEIEEPSLCEDLKQLAMFGSNRILDSERGARCQLRDDVLVVANDVERFMLDQLGSVAIMRPARQTRASPTGLNPIIEEEVTEAISTALRFAHDVLERIDPSVRLSVAAPMVALQGSAVGWRTRAEQQASPQSMSVGLGSGRASEPVTLVPATRPRRYLSMNSDELAQDFTVLLRRQMTR
jgi:Domain of unknown function (DUF4062)